MVQSNNGSLGRLEQVPIRDVWPNEDEDFTPWLEENISYIGDLIGVDIDEIQRESAVGNFSADLIGKIPGDNNYIVIENQFRTSDHDHLGKLLTYLSGKEAKIGVWIAEDFREEHISALTYLNESIRSDGLRLFAIKVQIRKIDSSKPAPEFSIVVAPNDFQRSLSHVELSDLDRARVKFFNELVDKYKEINPRWNKLTVLPQSWLSFSAGKTGFAYSWAFKGTASKRFTIELYIDRQDVNENAEILRKLKDKQEEIEKRLEFKLNFEELPGRRAKRVEVSKDMTTGANSLPEQERKELINWGWQTMKKFTEVVTPYLREVW
jgi:hypothetical protein